MALMAEAREPIRVPGLRPVTLQCGRVDVDGGCVRSGQPCALDDGSGHDSCPFVVGDDDGDVAYLRVAITGRRPYGEVVEVIAPMRFPAGNARGVPARP